jgi:thioredoxin reductase (NADPH)
MTNLTGLERSGDAWQLATEGESLTAHSVILATGTRLRDLGVPGEADLRGHGVSHCASCDAPLLRNQAVVVAGGGDSALQEALTLAMHCSAVTIVHHGAQYGAQAAYRSQVETQPKISAIPESEVTAVLGTDAVTGVRIKNVRTGGERDHECAAAFVFVGLEPSSGIVPDEALLDARGYIVTDAALRTRSPGLLAAGTVRAGCHVRAAAAAGDGAAAALSADRFLATGEWAG